MTTVMIVDDHRLLADGIARSLEQNEEISVVSIADDVASGRRLADRVLPDVALLDYSLPSGDGIELAIELQASYPDMRSILLTAHDDPALIARSVQAKMDGFVSKTATTPELVDAVINVAAGGVAFRPADLTAAIHLAGETKSVDMRGLSGREVEVLGLIATGRSTSEASSMLFISTNTTRTYVRSILVKFGAHSKMEAVTMAAREGIIDPWRPAS